MDILFNEELHQYTVDGVVRANVTSVLETLLELEQFNCFVDTTTGKTIPGDMVKQAGGYGRAVHKAACFFMQGKKVKYPDEMKWTILELMRWMSDYKIEPVHQEFKGYSTKLDVAGTVDLVCRMGYKTLNLVDYKTTKIAPTVGPQTWAYEQIYREMTGYKGMIKRWCLTLPKKDGEYKFVELNDPYDEHYFRAMNLGYKWRRR